MRRTVDSLLPSLVALAGLCLILAGGASLLLIPVTVQQWNSLYVANAIALSLCAYLLYLIHDLIILNHVSLKQE